MLLPNADDVLDPLAGLGTGDQARPHEAMSEEAPRYSPNGNRHGAIELGMDVDSEGAYDDAADGRDRDTALLSESPESGDILINLARLMEMITIQIYRVRCHPKNPAGEYPCIDKIHETQENPAAQVLQSTSEFTGILERFLHVFLVVYAYAFAIQLGKWEFRCRHGRLTAQRATATARRLLFGQHGTRWHACGTLDPLLLPPTLAALRRHHESDAPVATAAAGRGWLLPDRH